MQHVLNDVFVSIGVCVCVFGNIYLFFNLFWLYNRPMNNMQTLKGKCEIILNDHANELENKRNLL